MNEIDIKNRKQWLVVLITNVAMNFLFTLFNQSSPIDPKYPAWVNNVSLYFALIAPLIFIYILYRCAYRKPGTKLLMFILITAPIGTLYSWFLFFQGKLQLPSNALFLPYFVLSTGLAIWLYFLHWKMRKINKKLKQLEKAATV